jgi:HD-like signal output (HDOD) protein
MSSELVRRIVADNVSIPTLPSVVARINALLEDENSGTREIGAEIAKDAPLSTRVLRIANSAAYGLRQRVVSPDQACAVLGMRALRNLVLQASVIGQYEHLQGSDFDLQALWLHSILCAQVCQSLARQSGSKSGLPPEEFYTCGLLLDIGQVVLLDHAAEDYLLSVRRARQEGRPLHAVEQELLGFSHAEIGARVALRWGLAGEVVSSIQFHHGPEDEIDAEPAVGLVELGNRLADCVLVGDRAAALGTWTEARGAQLGLERSRYATLVDQAFEALPRITV